MAKANKSPRKKAVKTTKKAEVSALDQFKKDLLESFEIDVKLETKEGVKIDYGKFGSLVILRANKRNQKYMTAVREKFIALSKESADNPEFSEERKEERSREIMAEIYVEAIVLNMFDGTGREVGYGPEAQEVLKQIFITCPDYFERVQADASESSNFRRKKEERETASKN